MKNSFLTLLISLLAQFTFAQTLSIQGAPFIYEGCCEEYVLTNFDSLQVGPGVWLINDAATGQLLDSIHSRGPGHSVLICTEDYPGISGPLTLTFNAFNLSVRIPPITIQILPPDLYFEDNYDCIIREVSGTKWICEGEIGNYIVESQGTNNWHVSNGTILRDDGYAIEVLWDNPGLGTVHVDAEIGPNCIISRTITVNVIPKPSADFETDPPLDINRELTVCRGQNIFFKNTSINALNHQWLFQEHESVSQYSPTISYDRSGTYRVQLLTPSGCHCTDTIEATVIVTDDLAPQLTCIGTTCPDEDATYYVETQCDDVIWTVSPNGTVLDGGGLKDRSITVDWHSGPVGTITVEGMNCPAGFCNAPNTFEIPVISSDGPVEGDTEVCIGDIREYTAPRFQGTDYYWTVESGGRILGNSTGSSVTVQWIQGTPGSQKEVKVVYENCYLECGGEDALLVTIRGRFEIAAPEKICAGESLDAMTIEVQSSNPVPSQWTILDDQSNIIETSGTNSSNYSTGSSLTPGTYTLVARNNSGLYCDPEIKKEFEVVPLPEQPMAITGGTEICPGSAHLFSIDDFQAQYDVQWEINDGGTRNIIQGKKQVSLTFNSAGPYEISARYISPIEPHCPSPVVNLQLNALSFSLNGPSETCVENTTRHVCTRNDLSDYTWTVDPPSAGLITEGQGTPEIEVFWTSPGSHTVELNACNSTESTNVQINDVVEPDVIHPEKLCPGASQKVTLMGSYDQIEWRNDTGMILGAGRNIFFEAGSYVVKVTNATGCSDSLAFRIKEIPLPDATISINDERSICETEPFAPRRIYANTNGNYTYEWYKDGASLGAGTSSLDVTEFGTYHVVVFGPEGCIKESNTIRLFENCDGNGGGGECTGGNCRKATCPDNLGLFIDVTDDPVYCNIKTFRNTSTVDIIQFNWVVEDLINSDWTIETDDVLTDTFPTAGYYTIYLDALVRLPGPVPDSCLSNKPVIVTVPVAADFTFEKPCPGEAVSFQDASSYIPGFNIVDWQWDFGDPASANNTSSDRNPDHQFSGPGNYTVTLTIEESGGCISVIQKDIEVEPVPQQDFSLPNAICASSAVRIEALTSHFKLHWDFGDPGSTADTASSRVVFYTYPSPGQYSITMTAYDENNCSYIMTKSIDIIAPPPAKDIVVNGNNPMCEGEVLELQAPEGDQWRWSTGETTRTIQVSQPGRYSVQIGFANGCSYESPELEVYVDPLPRVLIYGEKTDGSGNVLQTSLVELELCEDERVNLRSITGGSYNYRWSNNWIAREINQFSPGVGAHNFTLECTDPATGCVGVSNPLRITVHPLPDAPRISSHPPLPICEGQDVQLMVDNVDTGLEYVWSTGETGTSIIVTGAGEYYVTAIGDGGCSSGSNELTIHPLPDASVILTGCFERCASDTFCMPDIGNMSIQWYRDGQAIPSPEGQDPNYVIDENGVYNVELTNANGCTDISGDLTYDILPGYGDIFVRIYFDVNGNGIIDAADTLINDLELTTTLSDLSLHIDSTGNGGQVNFLQQAEGDYHFDVTDGRYLKILGTDSVTIIGCDKRYEVELLVAEDCPTYEIDLDTTICPVDTLFFTGDTITQPGQYTILEKTVRGCDSTIYLDVALSAPQEILADTIVCHMDTILYAGRQFFQSGSYKWTDTTAQGCIEEYQFDLQRDIPRSNIDTTICPLQVLVIANDTIDQEGKFQLQTTTSEGCDSMITVNVSHTAPEIISIDSVFCNYDTLWFGQRAFYLPGTYQWTDTTAFGCLRDIEIRIDRDIVRYDLDTTVCAGETLDWNGEMYSLPGQYSFQRTTLDGCVEEYDLTLQHDSTSAQILVTVWLDINENGVVDGPDSLLSDIPLQLTGQNGSEEWGTTGTDGEFIFGQLLAGIYEIGLDTSRLDGYIIRKLSEQLALNDCGESKDVVFLLEERPLVFVPNVFTPNGDNINDVFRLYTKWEDDLVLHLSIYDRWGEKVFQFDGENSPSTVTWDGRLNNEAMTPAVFVYVAEVRHRSGQTRQLSGSVTLVK